MSLIHFGCWGDYNNKSHIENVLKEINVLPTANLMTISGDNYYPNKVDKQKILNKKHFHELHTLLDTSTSKIDNRYILLGNHEFDSYIGKDECTSIDLHRKFYEKSNINLIENCFGHMIEDHTLVIMLNTSIYETINNCYEDKNILQKNKDGETNPDVIENQLSIVRNLIETDSFNSNNIIFVGHHPIISCRASKKKDKGKNDSNKYYLSKLHDFFLQIQDLLRLKKNIYYLTSDTHCYQHITVFPYLDKSTKIEQYIVGTGGAKLDKCSNILGECSKIMVPNMKTFMTLNNTINDVFGFLYGNFNLKNNNWEFNFIPEKKHRSQPKSGFAKKKKSKKRSNKKKSKKRSYKKYRKIR